MSKPRKNFRIVFMGTPVFAVQSLKVLHEAGYYIAAVVTTPDKPAGRGLRLHSSPVKDFAVLNQLPLLQPVSLKGEHLISTLSSCEADLFVVVAFRMLPEIVWKMPAKGTINLHASLLPQYRGAAPINWAIINGEQKTGVTTFFIDKEIDTGRILQQKDLSISSDETAGELHDRLMLLGAALLLETVDAIREGMTKSIDQSLLVNNNVALSKAPRIFKEDCRIDWNRDAIDVHNFIRGLSPYPAAYTTLQSPGGENFNLKIFKAKVSEKSFIGRPEQITIENHSKIFVTTTSGCIELLEVQLSGKSRIPVKDFLNGFRITSAWRML
jgi:methionyl-tRNA formyltransferase